MNADEIIPGEAERKIIEFIQHWPGLINYDSIKPIDIDSIPWPAYDMFPIEIYRLIRWPTSNRTDFCMPILTGRGCPYKCTFCYRMNPGFRPRSPEAVLEEIVYLQKMWGITHIQFSDELFMSSENRIASFCDRIMKSNFKFKWDCNGRLNFATPQSLKLMKKAGCEYINYGIEALNDGVLEKMNKHLTVDQIYRGVENTIKAGIYPGLNFMWGNIGDTKETLSKAVDFLLEYDGIAEFRTIRPVTPYPGSALYAQAVEGGLLDGPEDFYARKHINSDLVTVNFTDLSDDEFRHELKIANCKLLENYYNNSRNQAINEAISFYNGEKPNFRGFREV